MKMIVAVALGLVALAAAAPPSTQSEVVNLRSSFAQNEQGGYIFGFENSDGNKRDETGTLKEVLDEENKPHTVVVVRGSYGHIDEEGKEDTINYYADESGYHAEGPSVPQVAPSRR